MTTAHTLLNDINAHAEDRRASEEFIKELGYVKTENHVTLKLMRTDGEGYDTLDVIELVHVDSKKEAPFSFLHDPTTNDGVVLPYPFSKYQGLHERDRASLAQ